MSYGIKGIKILAPAKVNLTLEILGKRDDGYHEIRSLIQTISLYDFLWIKDRRKGLELYCPGHPELENENNLIIRGVRLLEKELGCSLSYTIRLLKRIPVGGGLGGGSSDCAAVLAGLNSLLGGSIPSERLRALATRLGSDVPFFLTQGTALALSRGERIEPWKEFPSWWFVLVFPEIFISTSWAYGQVKFPLTEIKKTINVWQLKEKGIIPEWDGLRNDLEEVVFNSYPILGKIKKALLAQGCLQAMLSGSGSTIFGIWEDRSEAARAFRQLNDQGWGKIFLAKGL
jgi:4-diphosphocytidyl-2-C-methyl-D-erythritol kinase